MDGSGRPRPPRSPCPVCHTKSVALDPDDRAQRLQEWEAKRKQLRRAQDVGLLIVTVGLLFLAYAALLATGR